MSNVLIVPFYYDGSYDSQRYRLLFDFFKVQSWRWADVFDCLYLGDSGWNLTDQDRAFLDRTFKRVCIVQNEPRPHWTNVRYALEVAARDDVKTVCLMDSDTILYDGSLIVEKMRSIEDGTCDVVAITDGSGGRNIGDSIPQFRENEFRAERRRLAPYLLMARRSLLDGLDFAPRPHCTKWTDSFGQATVDIMRQSACLDELEDDRCTLYLQPDGTITASTNLDGPPYLWSTPLDKRKSLGYHHVRNFGAGVRWLDEFYLDRSAFDREMGTTPPTEFFRLLGWCWVLSAACRRVDDPIFDEIVEVVNHAGVTVDTWRGYVNEWPEYYEWVKKLWTA